ncbi:MAG: formyltransferase family protein [Patescibacteria group bacterium]
MKITLVSDNPGSWIHPYVAELARLLRADGHDVSVVGDSKGIPTGGITFLLACERIISEETLGRSLHNLVIHESALPKGRGWSPMTWQILEGKNEIPITLFEAEVEVDSGAIYFQDVMKFKGHELVDELRKVQGEKTIELARRFVREYPNVAGREQTGEVSHYERRRAEDSELDSTKTLAELFDQLRVVDNERYPAYFRHRGHVYTIKITKA